MAHQSFGTVRLGAERESITFDFGLYGEQRLTVKPEPTLADVFDLADAPEFDPDNALQTARFFADFIRKMLVPDDIEAYNDALRRIPASQSHIIYDAASWITRQLVPFVSAPPARSSGGRRTGGTSSKRKPARSRSR
jgi:hypothetical protein